MGKALIMLNLDEMPLVPDSVIFRWSASPHNFITQGGAQVFSDRI